MIFSILLLVSGLTLSAVAIYYSVIGLTAIFAAAFWPIVVMGATLEVSKLVAASWLKAYWTRIPKLMKLYMTTAVIVLMLITSMGIFGYLSKAHSDQAVPVGDIASKVALLDERINNERETIANARTLLKQLDDAVIGIQSGEGREVRNRDGTTRVENPAERALQVRRAQAKDREALTKTINDAQSRIVQLQEERAPFAAEVRKVEAEVGPIKYIAKLIYGDNPDQNLLEKAVVWVTLIIVFVFDPLAVLLLLSAQMTYQWYRQEKEQLQPNDEMASDLYEMETLNKEPEPIVSEEVSETIVEEPPTVKSVDPAPVGWMFPKHAPVQNYQVEDADEEEPVEVKEEKVEVAITTEEPKDTYVFDSEGHAKTYVPEQERSIVDDIGVEQWNKLLEKAEQEVERERQEQRLRPDFTEVIDPESSKKKITYMIKEQNQQIKKTREE